MFFSGSRVQEYRRRAPAFTVLDFNLEIEGLVVIFDLFIFIPIHDETDLREGVTDDDTDMREGMKYDIVPGRRLLNKVYTIVSVEQKVRA